MGQNELFSPIKKSKNYEISKSRISENTRERLTIFGLSILHGVVLGSLSLATVIGIIENNIYGISFWVFIVSFPLGLALRDIFKSLMVFFFSLIFWLLISIFVLVLPSLLGVVASPDFFILGQISYVISFVLFVPGPLILGLCSGAIISELF